MNGLPDMYLDQVAEFITQNAGEYQGPVDSGPTDPFTGITDPSLVYIQLTPSLVTYN